MYRRAASLFKNSLIASICFAVVMAFCATTNAQDGQLTPPPANDGLSNDNLQNNQENAGTENQEDNSNSVQNNQQDQEGLLPPLGPTLEGPGSANEQVTPDQGEEGPQPDVEPPVFVNEEFAGWGQAGNGLGGIQVSETLRSNWVMLGPNGKLSGQVLTFDGTIFDGEDGFVVHLVQKGKTVASGRTDANGRFEINGVDPGTYTITGLSFDNFFAFGFNAIGYQEGSTKLNANIQCIAIPRFGSLLTDLVKQNAPNVSFRVYGQYKFGEGDDDPARLLGLDGIAIRQPDAVPATSIQAHRLPIEPDGRVIGRIHQIHNMNGRPVEVKDTGIYLIRENVILARAKTNYYGVFEFKNVQPGFYGLVAAGKDGFAAIAVEVVPAPDVPETGFNHPSRLNSPSSILASVTKRIAGNSAPMIAPFDIALAASENIGWINKKIHDRTYAEALADNNPRVWRPAYWAIDDGFTKIPLGPDGRPLPGSLNRRQWNPYGNCQPTYPGGGWAYGPICESDYWLGGGYGYGNCGGCGYGHYHGFGYFNAHRNYCGSHGCGGNQFGSPYSYGYGGYGNGGYGYGGYGYGGYGGYGYGGYGGYGGGYGYGTGQGTIFDLIDASIEQVTQAFGRGPNFGTFGGLTPQDMSYFTPGGMWPGRFASGFPGLQAEQDPLKINRGPYNQPNPNRNYWERDPRTRMPVDPRLIGNQNPNAPENIRKRQMQMMQQSIRDGSLPGQQYNQMLNQNGGFGGPYPGYGNPAGGYWNNPMGGYGMPGYGYPRLIDYRFYTVPSN